MFLKQMPRCFIYSVIIRLTLKDFQAEVHYLMVLFHLFKKSSYIHLILCYAACGCDNTIWIYLERLVEPLLRKWFFT